MNKIERTTAGKEPDVSGESLKAAVERLKAVNRKLTLYQTLVSYSNDHILMIDARGVCLGVSRTYLLANELEVGDVRDRPIDSMTEYPFFEEARDALLRLGFEGEPVHYQRWYEYPSLGERCMDVAYFLDDFAEGPASVLIVGRDVTEVVEQQSQVESFSAKQGILASALMQSPLGIIIINESDKSPLLLNPEAERIMGFTNKDLTDESLFDRYGPGEGRWSCLYPDRTACQLEDLPSYRALKTGLISKNRELILKRPDGEERWIMVSTTPVFGTSGGPSGIILLISDITQARNEQERIRINEERLNHALTATDEGLWDWNLETGEGYCSPRYFTMLGYKDGEFPGNSETWRRMIHPDDLDRVLSRVDDVLTNKIQYYEAEYRIRCKNDEYRWIHSYGLALEHDPMGIPYRFLGTHRDITEKKLMEIELNRSREELEREFEKRTRDLEEMNRQLEAIFNLSSESIWVCDNQGVVLKVNQATTRLLDVEFEEIVGHNVRDLMAKGLMDRSVTLLVLSTRKQASMIQYVPKRNRQLLVTGTPIFDENGEISLVVVVERDLTELNNLHSELERNQLLSRRYQQELLELSVLEEQKEHLVAESGKMKTVLRTAVKLASQNVSNILILGESGTGKGVLSKIIHKYSARTKGPFIEINCAALPETLLEAELFGYDRGAFTGARTQGKAGFFELANKGTLFLDEIGDLSLSLQAKLLKYLDDNTITHLGGLKPIPIDCTIIAATNRDLENSVFQKEFRGDLYYRLNTFTIKIPPLRERRDDVFPLARLFLAEYNREFGTRKQLSPRSVAALQAYAFPGNVRELRSLIKKAIVLSEGRFIDEILMESLGQSRLSYVMGLADFDDESIGLEDRLNRYERFILEKAMEQHRSTRKMADYLGTSQSSIVRKLKKHGLTPPSSR